MAGCVVVTLAAHPFEAACAGDRAAAAAAARETKAAPPFSFEHEMYDQATFLGRYQHFVSIIGFLPSPSPYSTVIVTG